MRSDGLLVKIVALVVLIASWEGFVAVFEIRRYLLPRPSEIVAFMQSEPALLLRHTRVTAVESLLGLAIAAVIGVSTAVVMVYSKAVRAIVMPAMVGFNAVPKVAFAPLLVVWLGLGPESKVATAFLLSVFPITVNMTSALRDTDPSLLGLVRLLHGTRRQELVKIRLPGAVPMFFDSLRVALPLAIVGAIIAEFVASSAGLGFLIMTAMSRANTVLVFAAVVMTVGLSLGLYWLVGLLERRAVSWRTSILWQE